MSSSRRGIRGHGDVLVETAKLVGIKILVVLAHTADSEHALEFRPIQTTGDGEAGERPTASAGARLQDLVAHADAIRSEDAAEKAALSQHLVRGAGADRAPPLMRLVAANPRSDPRSKP